MAMMKKKTKAKEKKAHKLDLKAGKENEQKREASKGKVSAKEQRRAEKHTPHGHEAAEKAVGVKGKKAAEEMQEFRPIKMDAKQLEATVVDFDILKFPLVTEKAVNMIEAENKLTFVVGRDASKPVIRKAVEDLYKVKVNGVNILRDMKARKRAIVTLDKKFKASDVATKLGVI